MKTPNLFYVILLLFSANLKSQVSGIALLSGQTNHSGIKVKFTAASGTAVTDSVYTDSAGNYSAAIPNGVYTVEMSKANYFTINYTTGNSQLLTNNTVLNTVTLLPGSQVLVNGNVSGNWTSNNVYIVTGDITIPPASTLNIQAGTLIKFNGNYSLTAFGVLNAAGTAANKITFTSGKNLPKPGDWNNITLNSSASQLDYCIVEYAQVGTTFRGYSPTISHSIFREISSVGIYGNNCQPKISYNEVYDIKGSNGAIGIWIEVNSCCGLIECNQIYSINSSAYHSYGIISGANTIRNNVIHDITGSGTASGITIRGNSRVENNYIFNASQGIEDDNSFGAASPTVINNTVRKTITGLSISMPHIISNNIITENTYGIKFATNNSVTATYNLVWNNNGGNYIGTLPTAIGQTVSTNSQGNAIDSYFNLSQDPLYASNNAPVLLSNSPANSAGNSVYSANIGFNPASACASSIPTGIRSFTTDDLINVYPNPVTSTFKISTATETLKALRLFASSGQEQSVTQLSETEYDISNLANGIYLLFVQTASGNYIKKLVVAH